MTPAKKPSKSKDKSLKSNDPLLSQPSPTPLGDSSYLPIQHPSDRDTLGIYLREISKTPLLTPTEEKSLALDLYENKNEKAAQRLVQANLRFVVKIAFEYARYGARVLDLIQEGNIGLLRAVRDYNPYKDVRLTTYAVYWIRSYIQDFLLRNWSLVRIGTTAAQKKLFYRLKKEQEKFEREGITPHPKMIAHDLNVEESDVKLMQERLSGGDVSLSAPAGGSDGESSALTLTQRVPDQAPLASSQLEATEQAVLFRKALDEFILDLDEREKAIFQDRLLSDNPKTLLEIGEQYGFTKERARQIEERIKAKLKDFLAKYYPDISLN